MTDTPQVDKDVIYESIALARDPIYENVQPCIDALEDFIKRKGLIIYGGLAIDYALRLRGGKIYADDLLQIDYDFLSPDSVNDARAIADMFHALGRETRAVNAIHVGTTKVDIGDNHWLADVSYIPAQIFARLPYVEWRGLKCIHPDLQRVDMHHSLAFPYENAPQESIFNRWRKDVKRFALLAQAYPLHMPLTGVATQQPIIRMRMGHDCVLAGDAAYAAMYTYAKSNGLNTTGCIPAEFAYEDGYVTFRGDVVVLSQNCQKFCEGAGVKNIVRYREFINLTPSVWVGDAAYGRVTCVDTSEDLVSVVTFKVADKSIRLASAQWLSMWFLGQYHRGKIEGKEQPRYLAMYMSVQRLIELGCDLCQLSVEVYGSQNTSISKKVQLANALIRRGLPAHVYKQPENYTPAKGKQLGVFLYEDKDIYLRSGEVIEESEQHEPIQ